VNSVMAGAELGIKTHLNQIAVAPTRLHAPVGWVQAGAGNGLRHKPKPT